MNPPPPPWSDAFGLASRVATFFWRVEQLDVVNPPHAHAMRRAFQELGLSGIACFNGMPAVYFKEVPNFSEVDVRRDQRRVWNHGVAPVFVLITPTDVHVYSAMAFPASDNAQLDDEGRLVETLNRASQAEDIRQAFIAIETGEYFRMKAESFNPERRVDRQLLKNLGAARAELLAASSVGADPVVLDAFLCRVVFACYLADRGVLDADHFAALGAPGASRIPDLLRNPATAGRRLYALFALLQHDFNGDLFGADLDAERAIISDVHVGVVSRLLSGENLTTGQLALGFWAYDFSVIPIETISAIYESFLRAGAPEEQRDTGTYYTPRFLAEVVIDTAIDGLQRLQGRRFLDPACGSGIFLVGLFHRIAEEWRRDHKVTRVDDIGPIDYAVHADALIDILRNQLFGIDRNRTACQIAAFSLYLALLDQLSPPAIRGLQARGRLLPKLVFDLVAPAAEDAGRTILCADFTDADPAVYGEFDVAVGNPPWVSRGRGKAKKAPEADGSPDEEGGESADEQGTGDEGSDEGADSKSAPPPPPRILRWCAEHKPPLPFAQKQIAYGFIWKAPKHLKASGWVCFLLPHGVLFNHQPKAIQAQRAWCSAHGFERIVNLSDLRFLLFEGAIKPALVVRYRRAPHAGTQVARLEYFAPKVDLGVLRAEMLTVTPEDRTEIELRAVVADLERGVVPVAWKASLWGTPRDAKFLERLATYPQLGEITGQARGPKKRWIVGQGFQPQVKSDKQPGGTKKPPPKAPFPAKTLFIEANDPMIDLVLVEADATKVGTRFGPLRRRPEEEDIFEPPHVIVTKGMRVAFANFKVVFRHAAQGIHGPKRDAGLLRLLAAYLHSPLARYFLFHTAANWGAERPEVHLAELLRVPFPLPGDTHDPVRAKEIVREVSRKIYTAELNAQQLSLWRSTSTEGLAAAVRPLVDQYFDVDEHEKVLIEETFTVSERSATPRPATALNTPALRLSTPDLRAGYLKQLLATLNGWMRRSAVRAHARTFLSSKAGLAVVKVWRTPQGTARPLESGTEDDTPTALAQALQSIAPYFARHRGSITLSRSLHVFAGESLFVLKPLPSRFWTRTAALNDADEIIANVLQAKGGQARGGDR